MVTLKLDLDAFIDDFFADTRLLGITAAVKNYMFCWHLNHLLGYDFRLAPDIEINLQRKGRNYHFPVYEHRVPNSFISHYLYHNQFDGEYLLPEFRHIDFLWLMKGDNVNDSTCNTVIQTVKSITGVQLVTELTNEQVINKEHMVF